MRIEQPIKQPSNNNDNEYTMHNAQLHISLNKNQGIKQLTQVNTIISESAMSTKHGNDQATDKITIRKMT